MVSDPSVCLLKNILEYEINELLWIISRHITSIVFKYIKIIWLKGIQNSKQGGGEFLNFIIF